jgi:transcriptional regulator with XRE-family HTH domain
MKTYRVIGSQVKRRRELLTSEATQKEFAFAVGISERTLRNIENNNAIIKRDVLDRLARRLNVEPRAIAFAVDGPRLVPATGGEVSATSDTMPAGDWLQPRYDTERASATMDADELYEHASGSRTIVCSIETKLNIELSGYVNEIMDLLGRVTWSQRSVLDEIPKEVELAIKRRVRELLVLLKGHDVWVYETWIIRYVPERDDLPPPDAERNMEFQTVLAFGPAGEYGETSLQVPVDYGQPRTIKDCRTPSAPAKSK